MIKVHSFSDSDRFASNCFVIESDGEYAVVDPSVTINKVSGKIPDIAERLKYILLTHCHFDHILEIDGWINAAPKAEIIIGSLDGPSLANPIENCYLGFLGIYEGYRGKYRPVSEGDRLTLGASTIRVIDSPGHTRGGVSYRIGEHLFVGDTLFDGGGYGRCDLPGGSFEQLEKTIIKIFTRECDGKVYPGHGPSTTLKDIINQFS